MAHSDPHITPTPYAAPAMINACPSNDRRGLFTSVAIATAATWLLTDPGEWSAAQSLIPPVRVVLIESSQEITRYQIVWFHRSRLRLRVFNN